MGNKETSCVKKMYFTFILTLSIFTQFSYRTFVVFFDLKIQNQAEKKKHQNFVKPAQPK